MTSLALGLKLSAIKTLSAVQRAINILKSAGPGAWYDPSDLTQYKATWRRNLLTWSEDCTNAAWVRYASTITADTALAPDGTTTADKLVESVANDVHIAAQTRSVSPGTYTISVSLKAAGRSWVALRLFDNATSRYAHFDLTNGVAGSVTSGITSTITAQGNGWYRCTATMVMPVTASMEPSVFLASADGVRTYTGDGTSGIYIWGAQLELGSSPTAYQKITDYNTEFLAAFPDHALYQDSAGTTPVTAVEQPVGLMLDKSQGLVLGAELVTNGDFSAGTTDWMVGGTWSVSGGKAHSAGTGTYMTKVGILTPGKTYLVEFEMSAFSAGGGALLLGVHWGVGTRVFSANGTYRIVTTALVAEFYLYGDGTFDIDNISVRELPGNHLIQPTATSRPTLSSRYNRLTETEFRNGVTDAPTRGGLLTATTLSGYLGALAFGHDGTTLTYAYKAETVTTGVSYVMSVCVKMDDGLSPAFPSSSASDASVTFALVHANDNNTIPNTYAVVANPDGTYSVSVTAVAGSSGALSFGVIKRTTNNNRTFKVTAFNVVPASDASLPYQRVNTATDYDYDFSKFPPYLKFDGVDDSLYTAASVDFTTTDKMTVFAGVHKASDAGACLLELSADASANTRTFNILSSPAAVGQFRWVSYGTVLQTASDVTVNAPATRVLSTIGDISGDSAVIRGNGAQTGSSAADQGTGNYGNYPLYVGRRNNASLPFNGRIYQLAIKGKAMTAAEITTVESFVNSKTKAY